jgi:hypothetical protein
MSDWSKEKEIASLRNLAQRIEAESGNSQDLENKIRPFFKNYTPGAQGACLSSLTALFLAGHEFSGDERKTDQVRMGLLRMHVQTVIGMIPEAEEKIRAAKTIDSLKDSSSKAN